MILALETSSKVSSVAAAENNRLLAEITTESKLTHSKTLIPHIEKVLKLANKEKSDIEKIAVSIGPGSFTGLRIGLAAAKAIAYALNIPLYGVPTLKSLAYHFLTPNLKIVATMDAQKNAAYRESYEFIEDDLKVIDNLDVLSIESVRDEILNCDKNIMLVGEKAEKIYENLNRENVRLAPFYARMPRAALVAMRALKADSPNNLMNLEPLYVRRSEAEALWEKRYGKD